MGSVQTAITVICSRLNTGMPMRCAIGGRGVSCTDSHRLLRLANLCITVIICFITAKVSNTYMLVMMRHPGLTSSANGTIFRSYSAYGFYRATACNATHGIAVAILSVCPSVRCVYCDKTKQSTANILIPHERAITLVFLHQQWLVGDAPFPLKSALKMTHPLRKTPTSTDFRS